MHRKKTKYKSDVVRFHVEKVKRKENGQLGDFEIAPDFDNGGIYKEIYQGEKKIQVIKDNIPF